MLEVEETIIVHLILPITSLVLCKRILEPAEQLWALALSHVSVLLLVHCYFLLFCTFSSYNKYFKMIIFYSLWPARPRDTVWQIISMWVKEIGLIC